MKDVQLPYQFALVPIDKCMIDHSYQRPSNPDWIAATLENFEVRLLLALVASQRSNDDYALLDGQQRWWVLRELGWSDAPCLVYSNLSVQDEAAMFAALNFDRKAVSSWFHYRALRTSDDPQILAIDKILAERAYEVRQSIERDDAIAAPSTVIRIYEAHPEYVNKRYGHLISGPETLRRLLDALTLAWRGKVADEVMWRQAKTAGMLRGISWWISSHPSVSIEDFAAKGLAKSNALAIVEAAQSMTRGTGSGKGRKIEQAISNLYGKTPKEPEAEVKDEDAA